MSINTLIEKYLGESKESERMRNRINTDISVISAKMKQITILKNFEKYRDTILDQKWNDEDREKLIKIFADRKKQKFGG